ncbi:dipeptide/oligopeptide/nickel ABC transporter permease/ATP-binding protein [Microbacterium sp. PRC9]|uniref:dipeptide/oligopeptide/nickel ABC transporter permease/ATP-binding protein n=1 Tax=Microbacterium sp. PRC9 TaxID=2962591 RepID=UPI002882CE6B|nr:dipeptide/oligopeptide/nickel ABC transporter permease/ATP-binding protein [Microbacterium sp. PRC9]MDT0144529.1 dipeptide/oligopeptide/nickel ABC transporter permease/ATP-binding protein [Microbacterium sp. PRC9]
MTGTILTPRKASLPPTGTLVVRKSVENRGVLARFIRKPSAVISGLFLLLVVVASVFASVLAPYGPNEQDLNHVLEGPSATHWLGTGELGKDVLSRMMYGGQITLSATLIAVSCFVLIGVPAGIIAGYRGGAFDQIVLKTADISFSVPNTIVLLVILAIFPGNELVAMAAWGIIAAPGLARVVRSATLGVREELYVRAAITSGLRDLVIIARHILPLVVGTVIVQASVFAAGAVLMETGLGFLGLGTQEASWGNLVGEASRNIGSNPWLLIPSGALIITFVLALNLLGDGLRDAIAERYTQAHTGRRRSPKPTARSRRVAAAATAPARRAVTDAAIPDALLSVRDLTVELLIDGAPTEVVSGVDFDLLPGEALGIVGESGCGKTITAVSLLGLLPAGGAIARGSVTFQGLDLTTAAPAKLRRVRGGRIGWISQDPIASLDPLFTAGSQVAEAIRAHTRCSRAEAKRRVLDLFAKVRLPDPERVYRSYPHQLSGGMAQRVGIAAAIANDPVLVIADEPTTALDVTVQADILELLRELRQAGTAIILITHDWGVLADLCERAVVMYAGQVVEQARVADVVTTPAHPYSTALLESDPHHALPGQPLPVLEGSVPQPRDWPGGCRFQNRCPLVGPDCLTNTIPLVPVVGRGDERSARCIHLDEQAAQSMVPAGVVQEAVRISEGVVR